MHPAYISILNRLSVDEAKILFHFKNNARIPFIDIYVNRYVEKLKNQSSMIRKGQEQEKS